MSRLGSRTGSQLSLREGLQAAPTTYYYEVDITNTHKTLKNSANLTLDKKISSHSIFDTTTGNIIAPRTGTYDISFTGIAFTDEFFTGSLFQVRFVDVSDLANPKLFLNYYFPYVAAGVATTPIIFNSIQSLIAGNTYQITINCFGARSSATTAFSIYGIVLKIFSLENF